MQYNKYAYRTPQKPKDPDNFPQSPAKEYFGNRPQSPKYKPTPRPPPRDNYFMQEIRQKQYSPKPQQMKSQQVKPFESRLKTLIFQTLSSADRVAQELLHYGEISSEGICSSYFLNREKLYSFISNEKSPMWEVLNAKSSKKSGWKQGQSGSSEGTQEIPIGHLERLEKIVYKQIIPILQTEFAYQRRRIQKSRKSKEWAYTDIKQGLILLERLHEKNKKTDLEDYAEVLEKFIRRVMDKEESLMTKLMKLQEKLQVQTQKTELLSKKYKKKESEQEKVNDEQVLDKESKTIIQQYQIFTKEIKSLFKEGSSKDSSPRQLKTDLSLLLTQIKNALHQEEKGKICIHKEYKYQKQLHSNCKEEQNRSEQQIKNLKEVVNTLEKQAQTLRQQCEVLEVKLKKSTEKLNKIQLKSTRLKEQNQELISRIEHITQDNNYKNNIIADYLNAINRLEEQLKEKDDSCASLQQQNERSNDVIVKKSEDYQQLLRHLEELEEKNKELEEMEDKAHRDLEEMVQKNYVREFEVTHITNTFDRQAKEIEEMKQLLNEKDSVNKNLEYRNKQLLNDLTAQGIQPTKELKDAEVQAEPDMLVSREISNSLNPLYRPHEDQNLLLQSLKINPFNHNNQQTLNFMNRMQQLGQNQNYVLNNNLQEPNPLNQYLPFSPNESNNMFGPVIPTPLIPNPFNQNTFDFSGRQYSQNTFNLPENVYQHIPGGQFPQNMNQHMPGIMNHLTAPTRLDSFNTEQTPRFDSNGQPSASEEQIHNQYRKAIGEGYANFFNDLNISNSQNQNQNQNSNEQLFQPELNKKETDIEVLHQTIQFLQDGLKNSQKEVQTLKNQNQLLIIRNQQLLNSSRGRELMQNPFNLSIPNNAYNSAQQQFNHIQREIREDYIPSHINKQVIQEVIRDLDQEKKASDERSFNLEQEINLLKKQSQMIDEKRKQEDKREEEQKKQRRQDWDRGHRFIDEDLQEEEKKQRRDDWDQGHRLNEEDISNNNEKERREDWDQGHRYQEEEISQDITPFNHEEKKKLTQQKQQLNQNEEFANPEDNMMNEESHREEVKQRKSSIQIPNMYEEFIQEKQPTVEELLQQKHSSDNKKSDVIGLDSEKGKKYLDLIKIDDKDPEKSITSELAGIEDDKKSKNPDQKEKGSEEIEPPPEIPPQIQEHYKLKQLLEITHKIKQKMADVLSKGNKANYPQEISCFLKEIQSIEKLLMICKRNTTKKVLRLKKIEGLKKEAEEQIKALQKKLQNANMYFSNITSNEEGSALSFPDQIQEILRLKNPYGDIIKLADESSHSKTKELMDQQIQTDNFNTLQSQVKKFLPADFKKFLSSDSLVNSLLNQSFIEELQNLSIEKLPNEEVVKRLESAFLINESLQAQDPLAEPESPCNTPESKQSQKQQEDLKRSRVKMQSEIRNLGTMIQFHKNRIQSLREMMLRKTNSMPIQKTDLSLSTPLRKTVLENQRYVEEINKAPKKIDYEDILQKIQSSENRQNDLKQLQQMFKNRQNQFQTILIERNGQIERLKAIMKKITQSPPHEGNQTSKSINKDMTYYEIEDLKTKLEELELALENQKTENQKLKLELKEQQIQQEMLKMKFRQTYELQINSFREQDPENRAKSENPKSDNPKSNEGKILENIELNEQDKEEYNHRRGKKQQADKVEVISGQNQDRTVTEEKVKEQFEKQKQIETKSKQQAIKRFSRQSERVSRQSQSEPKGTNSEIRPESGWKDLFPEYFGKKPEKR